MAGFMLQYYFLWTVIVKSFIWGRPDVYIESWTSLKVGYVCSFFHSIVMAGIKGFLVKFGFVLNRGILFPDIMQCKYEYSFLQYQPQVTPTLINHCVDSILGSHVSKKSLEPIFWNGKVLLHAHPDKILIHFALINFQDQGEKFRNCSTVKIYSLL